MRSPESIWVKNREWNLSYLNSSHVAMPNIIFLNFSLHLQKNLTYLSSGAMLSLHIQQNKHHSENILILLRNKTYFPPLNKTCWRKENYFFLSPPFSFVKVVFFLLGKAIRTPSMKPMKKRRGEKRNEPGLVSQSFEKVPLKVSRD